MSRGTVQIVGAGGTAPWAPEPPAQESVEGRSFLVNATDIARVVAEARTELVDLAVPDGFSPLSLGAITNIVHTLQMHRIRAPQEPVPLLFRPHSGNFRCAAAVIDTTDAETGRPPPDPRRLVAIDLRPPPPPHWEGRDHVKPGPADVAAIALDDARLLAVWFSDAAERCWRPGQPWPEEEVDGPLTALSARVKRQISRVIRSVLDDLPRATLADTVTMAFTRLRPRRRRPVPRQGAGVAGRPSRGASMRIDRPGNVLPGGAALARTRHPRAGRV